VRLGRARILFYRLAKQDEGVSNIAPLKKGNSLGERIRNGLRRRGTDH